LLANAVDLDDAVAVQRIETILGNTDKPIFKVLSSPTKDNPNGAFCAILMTGSGRLALQTWGRKVACMDSTWGTNRYGYALTALVVKDSHGNHFPAAYMIHSAEDTEVFTTFLEYVRKLTGMLPEAILVDNCAAGNIILMQVTSLNFVKL
jgi:hypothetical protein